MNHWNKPGVCDLYVCQYPQIVERGLQYIAREREKKRD